MSSTHLGQGRRAAALRRLSSIGLCVAGLVTSTPALALTVGPLPGAVSPNTLKLPDSPGSVRGLAEPASINLFSAQVAYGVNFELPSAAHGFAPKLGLTYAGELGNGPVGIAWQLGEASIRRTLRHGVPSYTEDDELELAGIGPSGRLVKIDDGTYRVEGQGNSIKVEREGHGFIVSDAQGTRYALGVSEAAREADGERISAWLLESAMDLSGQAIHYAYTQDQGRHYLEHVSWGPDGVFELELSYGERPDRVISYRTGYRVVTAFRLETVAVLSYTRVLRSYAFAYDEQLPLSRLESVHLTGLDGALELPETRFRYAKSEPATLSVPDGTSGWVLNERGVSLFDVDGDGMVDLLRLEAGNHEYKQNRGNGFADARPLTGASQLDLEGSALLDLDGDARPELVSVVDDTWRVHGLNGETWTPRDAWQGSSGIGLHTQDSLLADVNGDGRVDALRAETGGLAVWFGGASGLGPKHSRPRIDPSNVEVEPGNEAVRFTDVNGDGLVDAVWLTDEWMKIFLGVGDGTFVPEVRAFYPWHDGRDIEPIGLIHPSDVLLADLDRDGLADLVVINAANVNWFRGRAALGEFGEFRKLARPDGVAVDAVVTLGDANGNGSQDIVWSSPSGLRVLDLAGPTSAGMLEHIDNGLGEEMHVGYRPSALLSVEAEEAGLPWSHKLPVSIPVPTSLTTTLASGEPSRAIEYGVRDGVWDGKERRFGGFLLGRQASVATSGADTLIQETEYHPGFDENRVLRGLPWRVVRKNALGNVFSIEESEYETRPIDDLPDVPLLRKAVRLQNEVSNLEGVSEPIRTLCTYEYDGQGRASVERNEGRTDIDGDEKVMRRSYVDDDTLWVRDLVCDERLFDKTEHTLLEETLTQYGSDTTRFDACQGTGFGWVREVEQRLLSDTEDRLVTQRTATYDARGNPLNLVENGVARELRYDPSGLHVVSEALPVANLVWTATWSDAQQLLLSLTDPNGDTIRLGYDALGRTSSFSLGDGEPYLRFGYDWRAPTPTTTTWLLDRELAAPRPAWPNGAGWRVVTDVTNGAGELRYHATRLAADRFIVSDWAERDERGQTRLHAEPFYASSVLGASPLSDTRRQTLHYDALGRVDRQTLPNGAVKTIAYRAFEQTTNEPELAPTRLVFDGFARVIQNERQVAQSKERLLAHYDAADRPVAFQLLAPKRRSSDPDAFVNQTYRYDTLGRLVEATDPDVGRRVLEYDDYNRLILHTNGSGQEAHFAYDFIGRLYRQGSGQDADQDDVFDYDAASHPLAADCHLRGRLAHVTEAHGEAWLCYDALGREVGRRRTVRPEGADERSAGELRTLSASSLVLRAEFDDGFALEQGYDVAGRLASVGDHWHADELDAAGRVVRERYGNGLTQSYAYGPLGLPDHVELARSSAPASPLFALTATRNSFGAPATVADVDGRGLDQTASYTYDLAGRLSAASLGNWPSAYDFSYHYDSLQNMVEREATGPRALGVLSGTYHYGEHGTGPRQLTSVTQRADNSRPVTFDYDAAGRQIRDRDSTLVYDAFDRLVLVTGPPTHIDPADVQIFDMGTGGVTYSMATAVNAYGSAVGWAANDGSIYPGQIPTIPFVYDTPTGFNPVPRPGESLFPNAINSHGETVGLGGLTPGEWNRPYRTLEGEVQFLSAPGAGMATGVNDVGQIAGWGYFPEGAFAFRAEDDGTVQPLGAITGPGYAGSSSGYAIDFAGNVAGAVSVTNGTHAMLYTDTAGMTDLNTLIPASEGWELKVANDTNGEYVVGSGLHDGKRHAFRYKIGGEIVDLGEFAEDRGVRPNYESAHVIADTVNRYGDVVGSVYDQHPFWPNFAFLYTDVTGIVGLNDLVGPEWNLEFASGINDQGDIVGYGEHDGVRHAYLLRVKLPRGAGGKASRLVEHTYGYDGERTSTQSAGSVDYWFGSGIEEHAGKRVHYVSVGDRIVARVTGAGESQPASAASAGWTARVRLEPRAPFGLFALLAAAICALFAAFRRLTRSELVAQRLIVAWPGGPRVALSAVSLLLWTASGCRHADPAAIERELFVVEETQFLHSALSAGPSVLTGSDGKVVEERRSEPFGEPIDAFRDGYGVTVPDLAHESRNALNKQTDPHTGFSYHGARWLAPDSGRWLSPDPAVAAPDPKAAGAPWSLNPYHYAGQNPAAVWDPDGRRARGMVMATVESYGESIDHFAESFGVNRFLLRGVIAAESAGDPNKVSSSGYKGLAQAGKRDFQFDPDTSVFTAAKKYADNDRALRHELGATYTNFDEGTRSRMLLAAYNAGAGTVVRAVNYARAAGDATQWSAADIYGRAILRTGAYAIGSIKHGLTDKQLAEAKAEQLEIRHGRLDIEDAVYKDTLRAAVQFKVSHTNPYIDRIFEYENAFKQWHELSGDPNP